MNKTMEENKKTSSDLTSRNFDEEMIDFTNIKDNINQSKLKLLIIDACLDGMEYFHKNIRNARLDLRAEIDKLYDLEEKSQVQIKKLESYELDSIKLYKRESLFNPIYEKINRERKEIIRKIYSNDSDFWDTDIETESETDSEQEETFRILKEQDKALGIPPQQETDSSAQMEVDDVDDEYSNDPDNKYGWKAFCIERRRLRDDKRVEEQIALNTFQRNKEKKTSMEITNETKNTSCSSDGYGSIDLKDISSSLDDNVRNGEEHISGKLDTALYKKKLEIYDKYTRIINKKLIEFCKMHLEGDIEEHFSLGLSYYDDNDFM